MDGFKLLRSDDCTELFQLPDEEHDVARTYPAVAAEMDEILENWLESDVERRTDVGREAEFTDQRKRQLTDLGYLFE